MARPADLTEPIRKKAASCPEVAQETFKQGVWTKSGVFLE